MLTYRILKDKGLVVGSIVVLSAVFSLLFDLGIFKSLFAAIIAILTLFYSVRAFLSEAKNDVLDEKESLAIKVSEELDDIGVRLFCDELKAKVGGIDSVKVDKKHPEHLFLEISKSGKNHLLGLIDGGQCIDLINGDSIRIKEISKSKNNNELESAISKIPRFDGPEVLRDCSEGKDKYGLVCHGTIEGFDAEQAVAKKYIGDEVTKLKKAKVFIVYGHCGLFAKTNFVKKDQGVPAKVAMNQIISLHSVCTILLADDYVSNELRKEKSIAAFQFYRNISSVAVYYYIQRGARFTEAESVALHKDCLCKRERIKYSDEFEKLLLGRSLIAQLLE
mgnify:CR=1 FL=1|tara:strand:+ start:1000 stop:2001 length:1002 start_codon:yes stop_codon:yes gene_type:complete